MWLRRLATSAPASQRAAQTLAVGPTLLRHPPLSQRPLGQLPRQLRTSCTPLCRSGLAAEVTADSVPAASTPERSPEDAREDPRCERRDVARCGTSAAGGHERPRAPSGA